MLMKKGISLWIIICAVMGVVVFVVTQVIVPSLQNKTTVRLADGVFTTRVWYGERNIMRAMDDSRDLRLDQADLYVYDATDEWPVWVAGNGLRRDFVWLDSNKRVVYILKNAPSSEKPHKTYSPVEKAVYVLAVPGGAIDAKGLFVSKTAKFDLPEIVTEGK